jgi:hypothetical protein
MDDHNFIDTDSSAEPGPSAVAAEKRHSRAAAAVFIAVVVGALVVYEVVGHRHYWFFHDEWDFLAARDGGSLDLFRPHNEHWMTVAIIVHRVLYRLFGLHSYAPYQSVTIGLHLTVGVLLRVIMRRACIGPWLATGTASMFVLISGAGWENIMWAADIGVVGALACGLAHLILADHDGPFDRRDLAGLAFGVVGLMCSGVAVTMAVVVGLAALIRRDWRVAFLHTAPLATLYAIWFASFGRDGYSTSTYSVSSIVRFVADGLRSTFDHIGHGTTVGFTLAVVLITGVALAWFPMFRGAVRRRVAVLPVLATAAAGFVAVHALAGSPSSQRPMLISGAVIALAIILATGLLLLQPLMPSNAELRRRAAVPAALLAGPVVFITITAIGRADAHSPEVSHYAHVMIAMVVPALAIAIQAFQQRWRIAGPALIILLLAGVPSNLGDLSDGYPGKLDDRLALLGTTQRTGDPSLFMAFARSPLLDAVPADFRPFHRAAIRITVGWLREARDAGRLPNYRSTANDAMEATLRLGLRQGGDRATTSPCRPFEKQTKRLEVGDTIVFQGALLVIADGPNGARSSIEGYTSRDGSRLQALTPLMLSLTPYPGVDTMDCG